MRRGKAALICVCMFDFARFAVYKVTIVAYFDCAATSYWHDENKHRLLIDNNYNWLLHLLNYTPTIDSSVTVIRIAQ